MSAPVLWFFLPFLFGSLSMLFSEKRKLITILAIILCLFLAFVALTIPINSMIVYGNNSLIFTSTKEILGRSLTLERSSQPILAFLYLFAAIWFFGALVVQVHRLFVPIAIMDIALIIGVISVKPFIYGAFFVEFVVLLTMPLFWVQRTKRGDGILRFLFFQTFGLAFIALGGWLSASVDINPSDEFLVTRAAVIFFLGFIFWLAIFPFHDWVAVLMDETCPYVSGFVMSLLQFSTLFILLNFLNTYAWMRSFTPIFSGLKIVGTIMLLLGSIWAFFQKSLQRLEAYSIVAENGFSLLLLGIKTENSIHLLLSFLIIRVIAAAAWSLAVKILSVDTNDNVTLQQIPGLFKRKPVVSIALLASFFSVAGLPLFAGFPLKIVMISLGFSQSALIGTVTAAGCWFIIITGFKITVLLLSLSENDVFSRETGGQTAILIVLILIMLSLTFFPLLFNQFIRNLQFQFPAFLVK